MTKQASINPCVLAINGGSSSIKFALFQSGESLTRILVGRIEGWDRAAGEFTVHGVNPRDEISRKVELTDRPAAVSLLMDWVEDRCKNTALTAVGHRVVHGGTNYWEPQRIGPDLIEALRQLGPLDPEHLPNELLLIEALHRRFPDLAQIACFDTAFHHDMPGVATLLPIPRRYQTQAQGVRRYGFHGLSYAYLMEELARLGDPAATNGRVILAHLGNGASLAAVRDGQSVDTSMGLTPTGGLMMSTRSGDLDPGLAGYLARAERMTPEQFHRMVNQESGLLGVSETSSDMRDLLAREEVDRRAAEAVALFCYQAKKWIGSFAAALGGLDTVVFAGGIGENSPVIRARICAGLGFLGIELNESCNAESAALISTDANRVRVRVIRTDEELMIARSVAAVAMAGVRQSR